MFFVFRHYILFILSPLRDLLFDLILITFKKISAEISFVIIMNFLTGGEQIRESKHQKNEQ